MKRKGTAITTAAALLVLLYMSRRAQASPVTTQPTDSSEPVKINYGVGKYGMRDTVPHPVRLWSDDDYTTSTDIDTFVSRIKTEAFNNWKYGSRTGGVHPSWFEQAFDNASVAYKHGSYFADGGAYFAFVSHMIWEPRGQGYINATYALNGMPMPERV